jgi:putative copper resistance protein D
VLVWLLRDLDLLTVLLRAAVFSFEALTLGGLAFILLVLPATADLPRCRRWVSVAALGLCLTQLLSTSANAMVLVGGSGFLLADVASIPSFRAGEVVILSGLLLFLLLRLRPRGTLWACLVPALPVLGGSVAMSHAASRMEDRLVLAVLTAFHHLGSAGWLGAMPFLLLTLRRVDLSPFQLQIAKRYSALALGSVALLLLGGAGLAWVYVGSWAGAYGTSYGLLVGTKVVLTTAMLVLGAGNFLLLRNPDAAMPLLLKQLRRLSEAEIGLGFTILLAAASLTSQSPAADVPSADRASGHAIIERLHWTVPRLTTPHLAELTPPATTMRQAAAAHMYSGSASDARDRAWSEYNHHWAGLIVLAAAMLALVGRVPSLGVFARAWPLLFLALAGFILLRADPEAWPLGPRGFWESFAELDALEHRLEAALVALFGVFEWSVRSGRLCRPAATWVFPLVCALGGALLFVHSHEMGNAREEVLATLSHLMVALLGVLAGWSRWVEIRAPGSRMARAAAWTWPICLMLAGVVLLDYRES